jgi:hypothetical protein
MVALDTLDFSLSRTLKFPKLSACPCNKHHYHYILSTVIKLICACKVHEVTKQLPFILMGNCNLNVTQIPTLSRTFSIVNAVKKNTVKNHDILEKVSSETK